MAIFDSLFLSFYKGVGAVTGSMLVGDTPFITGARRWRKRYGGELYCLWPYAMHCALKMEGLKALGGPVQAFQQRYDRMGVVVEVLTTQLGVGGSRSKARFLPAGRPQSSMVHVLLQAPSRECAHAANTRATARSGVEVFSRLRAEISNTACDALFDGGGGVRWTD